MTLAWDLPYFAEAPSHLLLGQLWRGSAVRRHLLLIQTSFIALDLAKLQTYLTYAQASNHASVIYIFKTNQLDPRSIEAVDWFPTFLSHNGSGLKFGQTFLSGIFQNYFILA